MEHVRIAKNNDRTHTFSISIHSTTYRPMDRVTVEVGEDYVKVKNVGIDFAGKSYAMNIRQSTTHCYFTTVSKEIAAGRYEIDQEESDEDQVVFYLNEDQ